MDRRDFFPLLSGALAALPLLAHAQTRRTPRIGVLWHAGSAGEEGAYFTGLRQGFRDLGYVEGRNVHFEHRFPNELPERFRSMMAYQQRANIAKMTVERRLPLGVWSKETFEAGALISYGADQVAMCRRGPVFVDKILKGAKPGELPVEQPTKLEFLVSLKTAKALGLTVPMSLLMRADAVVA
jgi:hypothetical protein